MLHALTFLTLAAALAGGPAAAEVVVAARTIRAHAVIEADDVSLEPGEAPGTASDPYEVVGQEARIAIYAGRPVQLADLTPPALVSRNQIVVLSYRNGPLLIAAQGRALDRGAPGEAVRVINLGSKATVEGIVAPDGSVAVLAAP